MTEEQDGSAVEPHEETAVCPECLRKVEQSELDMFGGLCEECFGYFD